MSTKALVELKNISKSFGPVCANKDISLSFYPSRIKALLGENGAGKSTLMSILAGRTMADSGGIFVQGQSQHFRSPKDAHKAGIGMVYQHFMLVDTMSVAENVLLGQEKRFFLGKKAIEKEVSLLAETYGMEIRAGAKISELSMGERQRVEILKLLRRESQILIFDEPTAVLTPTESLQLFEAFRRMAALGKSIVFISHKLEEVLAVADDITILRHGEVVDEFTRDTVPDSLSLASRMVGQDVQQCSIKEKVSLGELVLEAKNIRLDHAAKDINFALRKGEVLAIVGVAGNGQQELVHILAGLEKAQAGEIKILNRSWDEYYPTAPQVGGLAYIPEDRQGVATCQNMSLVDNLLLTTRKVFTEGGGLLRSAGLAETLQIIKAYAIRPGDPFAPARSLSGGNLQKLVIARELLRQPNIIVAENPTQGLDITATEDVWKKILEARSYAGVLLVTGDLQEALYLADRIAVMYRGSFIDCFSVSEAKKVEAIGAMMAGLSVEA